MNPEAQNNLASSALLPIWVHLGPSVACLSPLRLFDSSVPISVHPWLGSGPGPPATLPPMPDRKPVAGIDLGGTNIQIGVVSGDHKVIARAKRKSKPEEGRDKVLDRIADGVA